MPSLMAKWFLRRSQTCKIFTNGWTDRQADRLRTKSYQKSSPKLKAKNNITCIKLTFLFILLNNRLYSVVIQKFLANQNVIIQCNKVIPFYLIFEDVFLFGNLEKYLYVWCILQYWLNSLKFDIWKCVFVCEFVIYLGLMYMDCWI